MKPPAIIWSPEAPVASVLIASYKRTEILQGTIDSIFDTASDPAKVEVIVRIHLSDRSTMEWAMSQDRVRILAGGDDRGYNSMDVFMNSVAALATGDWLMLWSDENRIKTKGWDSVLSKVDASAPLYLYPRTKHFGGGRIPIVSRALYFALGHNGHTYFSDTYLDSLCHLAGIVRPVDFDTEMIPGLDHVNKRDPEQRREAMIEFYSSFNKWRWEMDKRKLGVALGKDLGDAALFTFEDKAQLLSTAVHTPIWAG